MKQWARPPKPNPPLSMILFLVAILFVLGVLLFITNGPTITR